MSTIKLVIGDLHLADGTSILDCFGDRQQAAFEGFLAATSPSSGSPLSQTEDIELVINCDCFDFLVTPPYTPNKTTDAMTAVQKIDRIIAAYPISTQYAYFDHFDSPINSVRQIAFLCLLDAELLIKVANDTMQVLSYP